MSITLPRAVARLSDLRGTPAALPAEVVSGAVYRGRLLLLIDRLAAGSGEQMLARYAPRLRAAGFDVRVATLAEGAGSALEDRLAASGIAVDALPFRRLFDAPAGWHLLRHVRRLRPDLIHTHLQCANIWGMIAAGLLRVPALATLHTLDDLDSSRGGQLMNRLLNRGAARIVCVSDVLRDRYQTLAHPPAAKLLTLHDGIELEPYAPLPARHRDAARRSMGIPAAAPLVMTVAGGLRRSNGSDLRLAAFELLERRWQELHYIVLADGEERAAFEAATMPLGLGDRVRFASRRADLPRLLGCADLFVLPVLEDPLPTMLAAVVASGLPVVATAVGSVPEMVEDGGNGVLVPPGDAEGLAAACDRLLASPRQRRTMAARGRQLAAERFAIDVQVARLAGLYDQLIAAR